jgi:hypothetical protein
MKTLVVGDIHGDINIVEKALSFKECVIFVGDFLDSFYESVEDQIECLMKVIEATEKEPGRVMSCLGNHELSYLDSRMQASGWNPATSAHVLHLSSRIRKSLKNYIWHKNFLISHAGVSNRSLEYYEMDLNAYLESSHINDIGRARGGSSNTGGIFWCDWWKEFEPIPRVNQIVGHSSYRPLVQHTIPGQYSEKEGIVVKKGENSVNYNIDCLLSHDKVLLLDENGVPKIINLSVL